LKGEHRPRRGGPRRKKNSSFRGGKLTIQTICKTSKWSRFHQADQRMNRTPKKKKLGTPPQSQGGGLGQLPAGPAVTAVKGRHVS